MKVQIIYYSKTGNTKKVAEAMASELGVEAKDVKKETLDKSCLVFLGSGLYAGKIGKKLAEFIGKNDFNGVNVTLFGTSIKGEGDEVKEMEELLKPKGAVIKGRFYCYGNFLFAKRGHPSEEELAKAREFAREMTK